MTISFNNNLLHSIPSPSIGRNKPIHALSEKRITAGTRDKLREHFIDMSIMVSCSAIQIAHGIWQGRCWLNGNHITFYVS